MKVIGINSSARKDGNTTILINTVFEELNKGIETEMPRIIKSVHDIGYRLYDKSRKKEKLCETEHNFSFFTIYRLN